ncbi:peroxide stress protein YaaA, partial [Flavobacterium sp.]|uniref:YaaA family protein n=1 Tax=Flavobacterium sp. TaxID=239 RepID=UPI0026053CD6
MKIVISPAKSLNFEKELPIETFTEPLFLKESRQIQQVLKHESPTSLSSMMHISDKLAQLNWERNQEWKTPFNPANARPSIYTFDGDVYTSLDAYSIPVQKIEVLQDKLRILSGLYGLLKPLDLMQAYRLEMGTKLPIGDQKNLYEFWKTTITKALNKELKKEELF